ncbi:MAG TPA: type III-B CRISPR module-associated Cmr3 family protein [Chitinophagales bacterium]|nr:hypothetical protein [Saprospiraceae bacterium]HNF69250.1 type III-B CRISPR module-associated Cmr3 family protein [Chitinophagales bacterium]
MHYTLSIVPEDLVFFRGSASFDAGSDNYATSILPPAPSVIYGALQSISYNDSGINTGNIWPDPSMHISTITLYVQKCNQQIFLFPLPADLIAGRIDNEIKVVNHLKIDEFSNYGVISENGPILIPDKDPLEFDAYRKVNRTELYIDQDGMRQYLVGLYPEQVYNISDLSAKETRTGLGREIGKRIAEEGKLYRIELIRTKTGGIFNAESSLAFHIRMNSSHPSYKPLVNHGEINIRLGGERKTATVRNLSFGAIHTINDRLEKGDFIKAVLTTPFVPKSDPFIEGYWNSIGCTLMTMCSDKELTISGWDMINMRPRQSYKAVSGGAIYFLKIDNINTFKSMTAYHKTGNAQIEAAYMPDTNHANHYLQGFGQYFFAKNILSKA